MCNQEDENSHFNFEKRCEINQIGKNCKKCGENKGIVVLRVKDVYCSACFLSYFVHKFRACLGKAKVMKSGDRVLVAFSGGQSSSAMIHLIKQALEEDNKKKIKYFPFILYVDEGAILNQTIEERNDLSNQILDSIAWTRFPAYFTSLEMIQKINSSEKNEDLLYAECGVGKLFVPSESFQRQQLIELFASISSLTAKEDLLEKLRYRLICTIAEQLKCNKVFIGDSGSLLSVRLLSNIAQGRGAQLKADAGFSHHFGESQINILRPMRELLAKEIAVYNNINKIITFSMPSLGTGTDPKKSISRLTEQFINELQESFPATVSTIFRTGDKIDSTLSLSSDNCILCEGYLDTNASLDSPLYSQLDSQNKFKLMKKNLSDDNSEEVKQCSSQKNSVCDNDLTVNHTEENREIQKQCSKRMCTCINKSSDSDFKRNEISLEEIFPFVCYGCRVTLKDCKNLNSLPENVRTAARRQIRRNQMREEISEFLL